MIINNIIQIIIGSFIGIIPWFIIDEMGKDPSLNSPYDPEGIMVIILYVELIVFFIWICWILYSLYLYKRNRVSLIFIGISNIPYIIFYSYGNLSIINLLLTPLTIFIHRKLLTNIQLYEDWIKIENVLLILLNIIAWIFLLYFINNRKKKN